VRAQDRKPTCAWCKGLVDWDGDWSSPMGDRPTTVHLLVCSDTCDSRPIGARVTVRDNMDLEATT